MDIILLPPSIVDDVFLGSERAWTMSELAIDWKKIISKERARFPYNPIHLLCIQFFVELNNSGNNSGNNSPPLRLVRFE